MAVYRGLQGVLRIDGGTMIQECSSWSLNIESDEFDDTKVGEIWKKHKRGNKFWRSEIVLVLDLDDPGQRVLHEMMMDGSRHIIQFWLKNAVNQDGTPDYLNGVMIGGVGVASKYIVRSVVNDIVRANLLISGSELVEGIPDVADICIRVYQLHVQVESTSSSLKVSQLHTQVEFVPTAILKVSNIHVQVEFTT